MRIVRVRRGFTTNSSAYTEWLPPPPAGGAAQGTTTAQPAPQAPAPASPAAGNTVAVAGIVGALVAVFVAERVYRRLRRDRRAPPREDDDG